MTLLFVVNGTVSVVLTRTQDFERHLMNGFFAVRCNLDLKTVRNYESFAATVVFAQKKGLFVVIPMSRPDLVSPDLMAWEYEVLVVFAADLPLADSVAVAEFVVAVVIAVRETLLSQLEFADAVLVESMI